jgi:GNAT superfamily N-acetyltransferase
LPGPPHGRVVDCSDHPGSAEEMERACQVDLERSYPEGGAAWWQTTLARRDRGEVHGALWEDATGVVGGYVFWEAIPSAGRRIVLWFLDRGHRRGASLKAIWDAFEEFEPLSGPVFVAPDTLPGVQEEERSTVLRGVGMIPLSYEWMTFGTGREVPAAPIGVAWRIRSTRPEDAKEVLAVACRAYWDYPGQLLWPHVNLERDLAQYAEGVRSGRPPVIPEATLVLEVHGQIRGNVVARRDAAGPTIESIQVDPGMQGRGVGRALLVHALSALREHRTTEEVRLNYLRQNGKGGALYRSVGFEPWAGLPYAGSGYWVRRKTLRAVLERPANTQYR